MTGQINQIKKAYQIRVVNMLCDDYLIKWSNSRIEHSIVLERSTLGSFRISIFTVPTIQQYSGPVLISLPLFFYFYCADYTTV